MNVCLSSLCTNPYAGAVLIFAGWLSAIYLVRFFVLRRLKVWAAHTETTYDDFIILHVEKTLIPVLIFWALAAAVRSLPLSPGIIRSVMVAGIIFAAVMGARFVIALIDQVLTATWAHRPDALTRRQSIAGIMIVVKIAITALVALIALDNMGVKISALVAGLGIGGVAVAFASQAILSDLFSYFVILFDRPFEPGDFIVVGEHKGTVEHIGIKTTRVRSIGGEQLILSNADLTNARLQNFKRMEQRRIIFTIGITYATPTEKAAEIPAMIKDIILGAGATSFERAHFSSFGDSALLYEIAYFVKNSDYAVYMDIQQTINLRIKDVFEKRGIEFAYPTQTILLSKP